MPRRCLRGSHRAHGLIKPMITMPDDLITTCTRYARRTPSKPARPCPCCVVHVWHVPAALPVPMPASISDWRLHTPHLAPVSCDNQLHQPIILVQRYCATPPMPPPLPVCTATLHGVNMPQPRACALGRLQTVLADATSLPARLTLGSRLDQTHDHQPDHHMLPVHALHSIQAGATMSLLCGACLARASSAASTDAGEYVSAIGGCTHHT